MMDEIDGVVNRKKKKAGGKQRKGIESKSLLADGGGGGGGGGGTGGGGTGGGAGESVDEEANYLTVTSVELRNWFRGITGSLRNTQNANT